MRAEGARCVQYGSDTRLGARRNERPDDRASVQQQTDAGVSVGPVSEGSEVGLCACTCVRLLAVLLCDGSRPGDPA